MKKSNLRKENQGITLIALVVTIIVLLILAGVSLNLVSGSNGILERATNAADKNNEAKVAEEVELAMAELQMQYYDARYVSGGTTDDFATYAQAQLTSGVPTSNGTIRLSGTTVTYTSTDGNTTATGSFDSTTGGVTIAGTTTGGGTPQTEEIAIGASVTYTPTGTYNWDKSLADTDFENETVEANKIQVLDSSSNDFKITSWKVLDVSNGTVKLVPSAPTAGTVQLKGYQGYNNAVKLLNEACSALYGADGSAESVSMEDIEPILEKNGSEALSTAKGANYNTSLYTYDASNSHYPSIYTDELAGTLGMSSQTNTYNGKVDGTSLTPKHTNYYMNKSTFSGALGSTYSSLFLPNGSSTPNYWVASRCVGAYITDYDFRVRAVYSGSLDADALFYSYDYSLDDAFALFPVVSLSSDILSGDNTNGFSVSL